MATVKMKVASPAGEASQEEKMQKALERFAKPYVAIQAAAIPPIDLLKSTAAHAAGSLGIMQREATKWETLMSSSLAEFAGVAEPMREMQVAIAQTTAQMQPAVAQAAESIGRIAIAVADWVGPLMQQSEKLSRYLESTVAQQGKLAQSVFTTFKRQYAEDLGSLARDIYSDQKLIAAFNKLNNLGEIAVAAKVEYSEDNVVSVDGNQISNEQIVSTIDSILPGIIEDRFDHVDIQIGRLFDKVDAIRDSKLKAVVLRVVLPFVISLLVVWFTPVIENLRENIQQLKPKALVEKVQKELPAELPSEALRDVRIVIAKNGLRVREGPSCDTGTIAFLEYGSIITAIEKKKDWTRIQYSRNDEESNLLQGWVFSRYIHKIDR